MRAKRGLTKAAVVEAAAELLDERPGEDITLAQVAERLGVRAPSLYNHVAGLDELRQAVALAGVKELGDRIGKAAIAKAGEDALRAIAWAYRGFAKGRPGMYLATQRAPEPGETKLAEAASEILHILGLILAPYGLDEREQVHAIRALRSLVHGFVSLEVGGGFRMPVDLDESFGYLIQLYVNQVTHRAFEPETSNSD